MSQNSSLEDVKKQYRKLVLIHHPDKNDNSPLAIEKIKEINSAYAELMKQNQSENRDIKFTSTSSVDLKDIFNYMFLYMINKPKDIKLDVHVDLREIYYSNIKKISYKIRRGDILETENIYIELCNYENEYVFEHMGDENIFTKERSNVLIKLYVDNNNQNLSINYELNRYELIYLMKINVYEYFYGINRPIDLFDEKISIKNSYNIGNVLKKNRGLPYYDNNDIEVRGDLIIFFEVDVSFNNIKMKKENFVIKNNIKEYFDILNNGS